MGLDKREHRSLVLWAADWAERALPYFEEKYPKDNLPRNAVEAGRAWVRGEIATGEARRHRSLGPRRPCRCQLTRVLGIGALDNLYTGS